MLTPEIKLTAALFRNPVFLNQVQILINVKRG